ncbi:MAG: hypothetical protein F4087_07050 [Gemmatimonadetes bacterium]|nr:hypothetical protein [Gemmatimonadota bacterium]MYJ68243.1 hypothetical protein [Gemmatimonadota bacterium]
MDMDRDQGIPRAHSVFEPAHSGVHRRGGAVAVKRALVAYLLLLACAPQPGDTSFEVAEASIAELQAAMLEGRVTSAQLVDLYLARIRAYDRAGPALNTIIRLNPRARAQADSLDAERAAGTVRGPLHGIPVLMKDNYDISWMPTTGSSLALAGLQPPDDAFQVARLREAGAVILGKTNLHELAAGITTISSLGGQTRNPYDPARNPGGSSGGTGAAVAASFAAVGWGTDTCGSIRIPSAVHNLFGLRPTKGLSSIDGILPLSHSQDTGGPLARTVTDLAIALDATVGMDPADPATAILEGREMQRFRDALDAGALEGARIGALDIEEGSRRERDAGDSRRPGGDGGAGGDCGGRVVAGWRAGQHRPHRLRLQVRPGGIPGRDSGCAGDLAGRDHRDGTAPRGAGPHLPATERARGARHPRTRRDPGAPASPHRGGERPHGPGRP